MSVYKRGGKWWIRFVIRGQRIERTSGLEAVPANKSSAKEQEQQLRREMEAAHGLRRIRREFSQASESFLRWVDTVADAPATARRNRTSFVSLNEFFRGWKVDEITAAAIEDYKVWRLTEHGVKKVTVRHDLDALAKFFRRFAVPKGMAPRNPMAEVQRPSDRDSRSIYVLSAAEEERYFAIARRNPDLYDLGRIMLTTGMRPAEVLALKASAFDRDRREIRIERGKTSAARRTIPLTDEHLVKLNGAHDQACEDSGVFFRLYDFRHTYATRAIETGLIDIATLAALMGHANLRAIHLYVHPQEATKRAAVDRYNDFLHATKSATPKIQRAK
jgi:integrase